MTPTLPEIACALRGHVAGGQVLAPGPGHSMRDRSLSLRLSDDAPDGFLIHSYAGDDWRACREHVATALGLPRDRRRTAQPLDPTEIARRKEVRRRAADAERDMVERRRQRAAAVWYQAVDPLTTAVEAYLHSRGLELSEEIAGEVLRFHPACPWGQSTVPAMVAAVRCVRSGAFVGLHRTALTLDGRKLGRKMFGAAKDAAIMLDGFADISMGLTVGEGIETCLTARQVGLRPVWAMLCAGNVAGLPVLSGIESLTVLAERDESGTSERACRSVGTRWHAAGRSVDIITPRYGNDLNDALLKVAA